MMDIMVKQFDAAGVPLAGWIGEDSRTARAAILKATAKGFGGKLAVTVTHPLQALQALFSVTEAGPRVAEYEAAYKNALDEGLGPENAAVLAAVAAKDVTVNFTRAGEWGRNMNEVVLFFNAQVQSLDKTGRTFWKHPMRTTARGAAYITFLAMVNYFRNRDEEWWKDLPAHEKWNYVHIQIPFTDVVMRIPLPFELGAMGCCMVSNPVEGLELWFEEGKEVVVVNEKFGLRLTDIISPSERVKRLK